MTTHIVKTTEAEAKKILEGKLRFIIRGNRIHFKENDIIQFRVIKNLHDVLHKIDSKRYIVTVVMSSLDAPINEGHQFIAFAEV